MDIESRIKAFMKEAEIYQAQGLLDEARDKYEDATTLIRMSDELVDKRTWLNAVSEKISALGSDFARVKKAPRRPELSPKVQDLIKNLFAPTEQKDKDTTDLEGAIALANFGQFGRALAEFNELIKRDPLRLVAAKNILRCHIAEGDLDKAIRQYEDWLSGDIIFSSKQFENMRIFLQHVLDRKGINKVLPSVVQSTGVHAIGESMDLKADETPEDEEFLDITLVGITLERGPHKGRLVELDVNFQKGNVVSMIVSSREAVVDKKDLIASLEVGQRIGELECSSAFAVFMASGVVTEIARIESGPNRGDFRLEMRIEST
jgi:hypothetical protein